MKLLTLTINKMFNRAPRISRKLSTGTIYIYLPSSRTESVFHIRREAGAGLKAPENGHCVTRQSGR